MIYLLKEISRYIYRMYWIYVIECLDNSDDDSDDDSDETNSKSTTPITYGKVYYIGQTKRLFRRFKEHNIGKTMNTSIYKPIKLIALYRANNLARYFEYSDNIYTDEVIKENAAFTGRSFDDMKIKYAGKCNYLLNKFDEEDWDSGGDILEIENKITESIMNKNIDKKIRGGKYVRFNCNYSKPKDLIDLPYCHCKLPCDVTKKDDEDYLYFRCAKKNIWKDANKFFGNIDDNEPCKFFQKYIKDEGFKAYKVERTKKLRNLFKNSEWLLNIPNYDERSYGCYYGNCIGKGDPYLDLSDEEVEEKRCCKYKSKDMISYSGNKKVLCFDCFINYNKELSIKYSKAKYMIMSDSEDDN
jgi:hypothetical protein